MPPKKYTPKSGAVNGTITGILLKILKQKQRQKLGKLSTSIVFWMIDMLPTEERRKQSLYSCPRLIVVKMDTEGHKPFTVEGTKELFQKFNSPVVHLEFDNMHMKKIHADAKEEGCHFPLKN
jgi:hypothetical protein